MKNISPSPVKFRFLFFYSFMLVLFFSFSHAQANDNEPTPKQIVLELISAMEVNDPQRIKAVFTDNSSQTYERWYAREKKDEKFRSWLKSDIIDVHGRVLNPKLQVDGNQVIVTGTYINNDSYKSTADFLFIVNNGKIVNWTMRYD
ncbi:hypothetical protein [Pseudoalteromonas sp. ASV78]|uniref:hypothetical protein n=1 Tax=Pseudoalteromonas sp. ASV78 TaxID=3397851 RepID=UPI0039FB90F0